MKRRVLFIDRDGTLIREPDDEQVDRLDKLRLVPGVIPALRELVAAGYELVMVSNQDGLGTDAFPREDFERPHRFLMDLLASQSIVFAHEFICPHVPADHCACRKPGTALLSAYLADTPIDREHSAVIGDREADLQLAGNLGVRGLRIDANDPDAWQRIAASLTKPQRSAHVHRRTRETDIQATLELGVDGPVRIDTGIAFFDHMLEQVARHGGFALSLACRGDLQVDEHHTVEDTALVLGQALREALGDKRGIGRYGFVLPMDEAQAQVAVDLSGRPWLVFEADIRRERVGGLPTELVPHFFRSLADSLGAAIQIRVSGENAHHMIEAAFKGLGRSLRPALAMDGMNTLPSTKGTL